jgi:SAM-dependent methyltransferase
MLMTTTDTAEADRPLTANERRHYSRVLKQYYEENLSEGQGAFFNLEGDALYPTAMGRHWLREHLQLFARWLDLRPGERFVDVGCGEGYYTTYVAQHDGPAIGLDVSHSALRLQRSLRWAWPAGRVSTINCDVEELPVRSGSTDKVLCSHTLEHVLDDRRVLGEIERILRPGGVAVLAIPLKYTWPNSALNAAIGLGRALLKPGKRPAPRVPAGTLNRALIGIHGHIRHYSVAAFQGRVRAAGLEVEQTAGMWFHDPRNWLVHLRSRAG